MFKRMRQSLIMKMILSGGITLLASVIFWTWFNVHFFKENVTDNIRSDTALLSDTVLLGLHYAMMLDSRDDIREDINNISKQREIKSIRIYNKKGLIVFSNNPQEVGSKISISASSCWTCHKFEEPPATLSLPKRSRTYEENGHEFMSIITPIPNSEGCAPGVCHVHSKDEQVLGLLEMEVSTETKKSILSTFEQVNILISFIVFAATFIALSLYTYRFVFRPINKLTKATKGVGSGNGFKEISESSPDEFGALYKAFNMMGLQVQDKQRELIAQKEEYRKLFENVPCLICVVDRNFRVIRHNMAYEMHFGKPLGRHCFRINKDRTEKCIECPVAKTFTDGMEHISEESGLSQNGHSIHWIVYTSPIRDYNGNIVAAMEMMVDITDRKNLEVQLAASEQRYHAIFDSIPEAVFVLDVDTLEIVNCNDPVLHIYGYEPADLIGSSFLNLFREEERQDYDFIVKNNKEIGPCSQLTASGRHIYALMRVSPAEFNRGGVLIVTCSDVTKKLKAEQQLIQASKMATLGEMASGVAHELNQPLAILKTISNLLSRKISKGRIPEPEILEEMAEGVSTHVDRASKIILHMREFGRKSALKTTPVQLNNVLRRGFEFFSQQLTVRNIDVIWDLDDNLPEIMADANRLEQVVINLLINARDAIEERWSGESARKSERKIYISSSFNEHEIVVEVCDTGSGIPEQIQERLFEPFFTTKDVGKGTGLGLSISYEIIRDYGGNIHAVSGNGRGACFKIVFPNKAKTN